MSVNFARVSGAYKRCSLSRQRKADLRSLLSRHGDRGCEGDQPLPVLGWTEIAGINCAIIIFDKYLLEIECDEPSNTVIVHSFIYENIESRSKAITANDVAPEYLHRSDARRF